MSAERLEDRTLLSAAPVLELIQDVTVLGGSPLQIALNGSDPDDQALTFTAVSDDALVSTFITEGNRSITIDVEHFGSMTFELFEGRAGRVTEQIISLAESGFYDGVIFHRVIDGFVIQGGDPTGTGTGGSPLGDFDDQFHVDLQHNSTGLLSMAKTTDDTNDSQFFITEGPSRQLDFNHSIFGVLTVGEDVREAISNVATGPGDRPLSDVTMNSVQVFVDVENGVLQLSAAEGATGETDVTVTVTDEDGNTAQRTFHVTVIADTIDGSPDADTINGSPFLEDVPEIRTGIDTPVTFTLSAVDVEGDDVVFSAAGAVEAMLERPDFSLDAFHVHTQLTILIDGVPVEIPSSLGIEEDGTLTSFIHTHEADNELHIESIDTDGDGTLDAPDDYLTLGDFFEIWRTNAGAAGDNPDAVFTADQILGNLVDGDHQIRMTVNGVPHVADPGYFIHDGDQIVIRYEPASQQDFDVAINSSTGEVTVTPLNGFQGILEVSVSVRSTVGGASDNQTVPVSVGPNIEMQQATADGGTMLSLTYEVMIAGVDSFEIDLFRSADTVADMGDELLDTVLIDSPDDLTVGVHTKMFPIGGGEGEVALPGAGAAETDDDYHILAVADDDSAGDSIDEDNAVTFAGVYHPAGGDVFVQGGDADDTIVISPGSVDFNGNVTNYADADVAGLRVRTHGGNDSVSAAGVAKSLHAWGGGGRDVLVGGTGDDRLRGGGGRDTLTGGAGNDTISGNSGIDWLIESADVDFTLSDSQLTGVGTDTLIRIERVELTGGAGDNRILAFEFTGRTTLDGGDGNDTLIGGIGSDHLTGGLGDDHIDGWFGRDFLSEFADVDLTLTNVVMTGLGNDTLVRIERARLTGGDGHNNFDASGFTGRTTLDGGAGNDTLIGGTRNDSIIGGEGEDQLIGKQGHDTIRGGNGNDRLFGGAGEDLLDGGDGHDKISGHASNDTLIGGKGMDTLKGQDGDDSMTGGAGDDSIVGGAGNDTAEGGTGDDFIIGEDGDDVLLGGNGSDTLNGGAGNDELDGGKDDDGLSGESGNDTLRGRGANDTLIGGDGNDQLFAGAGDDIALGGNGDDLVNGQSGLDTIAGNAGNDDVRNDDGLDLEDDAFVFDAPWVNI